MSDERLLISPDEAEALLPEGETIHANRNPDNGIFIGCDWDRADMIALFHRATEIEIAGPNCKALKHPIAVWDGGARPLFVQADMQKLKAFERMKGMADV